MKSIFIVHNQVLTEEVLRLLDELQVRGFTQWTSVQGRGSETGEPRMGSHTWPELNGALLCVVDDDKAQALTSRLRKLNATQPEQGLRAFVWEAEAAV